MCAAMNNTTTYHHDSNGGSSSHMNHHPESTTSYHPRQPQEGRSQSTSVMLCDILSKAGGGEALRNIPQDQLQTIFDPVLKGLELLDAESLLELERVDFGARLCDGINVRPIHNAISPNYGEHSTHVRYLHVAEVPEKYTIGIFVFPPFSKIPLHDHSGMCVLSRLLYGDLQCLSLDLVREDDEDTTTSNKKICRQKKQRLPQGSKRALKNDVTHLHAPAVTMSFPYERNLHEFFAGPQGAAVLDILLPPYDDDGRDCTFYDIHIADDEDEQQPEHGGSDPLQQLSSTADISENGSENAVYDEFISSYNESRKCWVYPVTKPSDFECLGGTYKNFC